jgi:hypothetical protein
VNSGGKPRSHRRQAANCSALVRLFRDHAPAVNLVSNRDLGNGDDGALKPKRSLRPSSSRAAPGRRGLSRDRSKPGPGTLHADTSHRPVNELAMKITSHASRRIANPDFVHRAYVARSGWRYQFPGKPSRGRRFHRVAHDDPLLYRTALGTIEQPMLKSDWARTDARQRHPRRALRATRALDGCKSRWWGELRFRHDAFLQWRERYRTLGHRWLPMAGR